MDSFEFNKMAGALLGALVLSMGMGFVAEILFYHPAPAKPGYDLPLPVVASGPAKPAAPEEPLPALLAKADPKKGEADAKVCEACHNFEKGAGPKIGPPLYGVVGRAVASVAGFDYSDALKKKGGDWTFDKLFQWVKDPQTYAAGTKMAFAGDPDPHKRADILAYLRTLSDHPVALPAAAKAPAPKAPAPKAPAPKAPAPKAPAPKAPAPKAPVSAGAAPTNASSGAGAPNVSGGKAPPAASDKAAPATSSEAAPNPQPTPSSGQSAPTQAAPAGTSSDHPAPAQPSTPSGVPPSDSAK